MKEEHQTTDELIKEFALLADAISFAKNEKDIEAIRNQANRILNEIKHRLNILGEIKG